MLTYLEQNVWSLDLLIPSVGKRGYVDALISGILTSPLAFVVVILIVVFLAFIGRVYVYPELVDKKVLEVSHKELFAKYQALLEKSANQNGVVEQLLSEGSLKELDALIEKIKALDNAETIRNIDRNLDVLITAYKDEMSDVQESLKQVERAIADLRSSGDTKANDSLRQLEAISRDCTDIIRRHDVITGALLQRLTGDSTPILKGLQ